MSQASTIILGIDVGGTKTALGLVRFPAGQLILDKTIPTLPARGSNTVLDDIVNAANHLVATAGKVGEELSGVGVALCELVDLRGKILSHNCLAWTTQKVVSALGHLGPVTLDADVRAAGRAEALFGSGRSFRSFLYVTVGTGISCSLVVEGVPYPGSRGATGTMASGWLSWPCEKCQHPNTNTLEQLASGPALVQRLNQIRPDGAQMEMAQEVLAAAARGELSALEVVRSAGEALGSSVALLINVLDPEAIVVGGGLGLAEGGWWSNFENSCRRHVWFEGHRDLPILRAGLRNCSGVIGAALAAWKLRNI